MIFFLAVLGAVVGSFSNMLIYRLPRHLDTIFARSMCPSCGRTLSALELIPIVSYVIQRGRCKHCQRGISIRYLVCELLSVGVILTLWNLYGATALFLKMYLFFQCMLILFFVDVETMILPDAITFPLIGIGLVLGLVEGRPLDSVYGFMVGVGVYFVIGKLAKLYYKKEAMGGGDVKLGGAIGAFWGLKLSILSCYFSFILGGIPAIFLVLLKMKKRTDYLPFGPAIILAGVVSVFWGEKIWTFYFG